MRPTTITNETYSICDIEKLKEVWANLGDTEEEAARRLNRYYTNAIQSVDDETMVHLLSTISLETIKYLRVLLKDNERVKIWAKNQALDIMTSLQDYAGLDMELKGCWLWIGGNTKEHKDVLKMLGCKWANDKKKWVWKSNILYSSGGRPQSMRRINRKYGTQLRVVGADPRED